MVVCDVCGKEYAQRRTLSLEEPRDEGEENKSLGTLYLDLCSDCDNNIFKLLKGLFRNKDNFSINNFLFNLKEQKDVK